MGVLVIAIGGGSGSGKTTLAQTLSSRLGAALLKLDDYYRDLSQVSTEARQLSNFDHPDALEWSLFSSHMSRLALGESVETPIYDFKSHTRDRRTGLLHANNGLIVEGTLALHDEGSNRLYGLKVFVSAPEDVRLERRLRRDIAERGRTAESVLQQFRDTVKPMHDLFVEPTRRAADCVIDGTRSIDDAIVRITRSLRDSIAPPPE